MTVCQVRDAANVLLDVLTLSSAEDRKRRLSNAARIIRDTQASNAAARASHAKARQRELLAIRVHVEKLRCCIPGPSG